MFQLNLRKEKGKEEMVQLPDRKHVKQNRQVNNIDSCFKSKFLKMCLNED